MAHALALPEEVSDGCTKQYEHAIARRICEAASYKGSPVPRGSHSGVAWKRVSRGYALREDLVRALKLIAIDEGRKLYEVIEEALEQYLRTCQNQQEPEALISPTPVGGQSAPRAKQRSTRPRAARCSPNLFSAGNMESGGEARPRLALLLACVKPRLKPICASMG